jgi:hypothetical protein
MAWRMNDATVANSELLTIGEEGIRRTDCLLRRRHAEHHTLMRERIPEHQIGLVEKDGCLRSFANFLRSKKVIEVTVSDADLFDRHTHLGNEGENFLRDRQNTKHAKTINSSFCHSNPTGLCGPLPPWSRSRLADLVVSARIDEQCFLRDGIGDDRHIALERSNRDVTNDG